MKTFETLVRSPASAAKNVMICLHGLGADGNDLASIIPQLALPENLAMKFIFPRAPMRAVTLNGGLSMRAWFDLYGLGVSSKIDKEGIQASDKSLQVLINQEIEQGIPAENIILAGFSQGGALAFYTGLTYPQRLGGIIGLSTFVPGPILQELQQPQEIPIFMGCGHYDTVVSQELSQASFNYLLTKGYQPQWHTYPMGHSICMSEIKDVAAWLVKTLSH